MREEKEQALEIVAVRRPSEIELRGTTNTWKDVRSRIEHMCSSETEEMSFSVQENRGCEGSAYLPVHELVIRRGKGTLKQFIEGDALIVEGGADELLSLVENIDCPNPIEGAHYHSDSWTPGVHQDSVGLVFIHVEQPNAF